MSGDLRARWQRGEATLGGWCSIPSPVSAEVMSRAGFDWICIDAQHGLMGYEQMLGMLQAIAIVGTPALVRVAWNEPALIGRALDAGAQGVIVPMVNSPEEARKALGACRYAPEGYRSWGPLRHALAVDRLTPEEGNRLAACVVMIETRAAVERLDEILSVPGIDAVYVGPMDLSVSYGVGPGELLTDPEGAKVFELIADACRRHGVVAGSHCPDLATARRFRDAGYRMLNVAGDARFLRQGADAVVGELGAARTAATGGYA